MRFTRPGPKATTRPVAFTRPSYRESTLEGVHRDARPQSAWGAPGALALACLAAGAVTLALGASPSYDVWSWTIWGREILYGGLDTAGGTAWKPLPVLFTTPFALAGPAAPALWMAVAR